MAVIWFKLYLQIDILSDTEFRKNKGPFLVDWHTIRTSKTKFFYFYFQNQPKHD